MQNTIKSVKGTETEKWLCNSYLAESQAYARYTFYAWQADKENYYPIGEIFRETANNELRHAKIFLGFLDSVPVETTTGVDAGYLGQTTDNLRTALKEESVDGYEFSTKAAEVARKDGFDDIASHFDAIAKVEKTHYDRFQRMLNHIENGTLWKRDKPVTWKCIVCGYEFVGKEPPKNCPDCNHPYQHYMAIDEADE